MGTCPPGWSTNAVLIGDSMDTDIVAGIASGLRTILVLTGVTSREQIEHFPYRPTWIYESLADIRTDALLSGESARGTL